MISQKMKKLLAGSSVTRAMFEEGKRLAGIYGENEVYDFSLGNPNVPAPREVNAAFTRIVDQEKPTALHGYMSNAGYEEVRAAIAASLNGKFGARYAAENIIMSVGAAGGLNVALKALLNPDDEVLLLAPYFGEYDNYISNYDGVSVVVSANPPTFMPKLDELEAKITPRTRAIIVNSPNNPSGVVYGVDVIEGIADALKRKSEEYGAPIYLISDEPYREIVYDGVTVPFIPRYYDNTIVGYSYSKSLSMPGERIGYLAISPNADGAEELIAACGVATRILGFVNAPSLQQRVVKECIDVPVNVEAYDANRRVLSAALTEYGFEFADCKGTFYLFIKCPVADDVEFCNTAKKYRILIVPGSSYACPGYARLAFCVSHDTIVRSKAAFKSLAGEYGLRHKGASNHGDAASPQQN